MPNSTPSKTRATLVLITLLALAGCQSTRTAFDYDKDVDFGSYRTYSWISANPLGFHTMESHASTLLEQRLMTSTRQSLADKGLRYIDDPAAADLLVAFTVGSRERITQGSYEDPMIGGYYGYGRDYAGGDYLDYGSGNYWHDNAQLLRVSMEGQVCIDLFDRQARRPVWHGTARETVAGPDVEYWRDSVDRIVSLIVAGYPAPTEAPPPE